MATIHVGAGGNLQTAITNAALGDTITLEAGATFTGNFSLPNKLTGSGYITITSDADPGDLPADGVRIDPTYIPFCATVASANSTPIISSAKSSHHFRFIGIYFPPKPNGFGNLIDMGAGHVGGTLADACTDMEFDRCLFRGHPVAGQLRAVHVGVTRFRFVNNYCDRFGSQGQQGNILAFANGEGEHVIENNYLSGSTQPILYGGSGVVQTRATVLSATASSAVLSTVEGLKVGWRISFLCNGTQRWPKCLTIDTGTNAVTFETQDVVPDSPGDARWGFVEKGIVIARNHIAHDPDVVQNGVLMPTTGVGTSVIAGNFGAGSPTYRVQAKATGYTSQEARGTASAATAPVVITQDQGVRVTWSAVANIDTATNGGYYIYRTLGGVITRFTVGNVLTFDDVGTGGTVVASVPNSTIFVGWVGIELKNGIDVHIHSNIIEWTFRDGFGGECLLIKCSNQNGANTFLSTENVLIENNVCRHTWAFGTVSASESGVPFTLAIQPRPANGLTYRNNLNYDSTSANLAANQGPLSGRFLHISNGAKNVHVIHNTTTHEGSGCFYIEANNRGTEPGLVIRDNMLRGNTYLMASNNGFGTAALVNATEGIYTFANNACSTPSQAISQVNGDGNQYAALATWLNEFVDGTGTDVADYALDVGSTYENDATDGTDIGCDITALLAAIDGVETGAAAGGSPVPTIVTTVLADILPDVPYTQALIASGGTSPYAWNINSGALPPGVALEGYGTTIAETSGILGYWRLNETTGTTAYDHMGGPNGAYTGTPTLGVAGTLSDSDKGVTLNGSSQYVLVGNVATLRPSAAVTCEAIVKPASVTGTQNIAGVGGPTVGYCLRLSGSEARFIVGGVTASVAGLSINTTYHLVGTYDGANVRCYVNGTSSSPQALTGAINYGSDVNFVIGQRHGIPASQYFNGTIEEVAVFDTALSGATITAHNAARTAAAGDELRGTPVLEGTYTFEVRVTDNAAETDLQSLSVVVAAPLSVPVITTTALPDATLDEAYSATLAATDGTLPYSWSVVAGGMPTGLSLDVDSGAISGTPTVAGAYVFDVLVQDALSTDSLTRTLVLVVVATEEALPTGRPRRQNATESVVFRRPTPPTIADDVVSGDIWIKVIPGVVPEGYIAQRTGDNLVWRVWPANEARVRQIALEELAGPIAKTAYVPTWTGSGGNPALGNGTIEGVYSQVGKHVTARIKILAGSTTTFGTGNWSFTLPVAADVESAGTAHAVDGGTTRYLGGLVFPTTTTVQVFVTGGSTLWGPTVPFTWASTDVLVITVDYWTA